MHLLSNSLVAIHFLSLILRFIMIGKFWVWPLQGLLNRFWVFNFYSWDWMPIIVCFYFIHCLVQAFLLPICYSLPLFKQDMFWKDSLLWQPNIFYSFQVALLQLSIAFVLGYLATRIPGLSFTVAARRTVAIETALQNGALASTIVLISFR